MPEEGTLSSRSKRYSWRFRTAEKALPRADGIPSGGFTAGCEDGLVASILAPELARTTAPMTRRLALLNGGSCRGAVGITTALGDTPGTFSNDCCTAPSMRGGSTGSPLLSELYPQSC